MEDPVVFMQDPYLEYQPAFSYSLPIQLLVSGITLTLLVMLLIHILFTTQYHYPLAPLNYCLQLASIISVLIGVCTRIGVILQHVGEAADQWPYSLDYVAVPVPAQDWSDAQDAAWCLLQALCHGLANITHIQYLTLLFPSRTEARLIFFALGPLAMVSSALFFCTLSPHRTVIDLGDAIRNVFSSCLLLIFTLALCIWGLLVNRQRAWRLDGGTGVFGAGALGLAFVTTASSFVAVKEEGIDWLQYLIWAAVLWQTWLGWWWWVGAGMGIGEVEDIMERAMRKKRRAARRNHRREVMSQQADGEQVNGGNEGQKTKKHGSGIPNMMRTAGSNMVGFTSGLASLLPSVGSGSGNGSTDGTRRRRQRPQREREREEEEGAHEDIELGSLRLREPDGHSQRRSQRNGNGSAIETGSGGLASSNSETSSTSKTPSLHPPQTLREVVSWPATWVQVSLRKLRQQHNTAAQDAAREQAARRARVPAIAGSSLPPPGEEGWGLGAYGMSQARESNKRLAEAARQLKAERLLQENTDDNQSDGNQEQERPPRTRSLLSGQRRRRSQGQDSQRGSWLSMASAPRDPKDSDASDGEGDDEQGNAAAGSAAETDPEICAQIHRLEEVIDAEDGEWEDMEDPREPQQTTTATDDVFSTTDTDDDLGLGRQQSRGGRSRTRRSSRSAAPGSRGGSVVRARRLSASGTARTHSIRSRVDETGTATPRARFADNPVEDDPTERGHDDRNHERSLENGWSWWGPLREWRLADRSRF